ncbi:hypothetical protein QOT17_005456 [Balamuthia mandrillaris]
MGDFLKTLTTFNAEGYPRAKLQKNNLHLSHIQAGLGRTSTIIGLSDVKTMNALKYIRYVSAGLAAYAMFSLATGVGKRAKMEDAE